MEPHTGESTWLVGEGVARVRARLAAACARAGRAVESVTLIGVSKKQPLERVHAGIDAGLSDLGENYIQELKRKREHFAGAPVRWHFIGHLQKNKAKEAVAHADVVHTVDSLALAERLARLSLEAGRQLEVLLQVNVGGEAQKSGCSPQDLPSLVPSVQKLQGLRLRGLMTIPPAVEEPEASRPHFRELARLARQYGLPDLSMGMSHDLEVAIEEGATLVRVGTALFGERNSPPAS